MSIDCSVTFKVEDNAYNLYGYVKNFDVSYGQLEVQLLGGSRESILSPEPAELNLTMSIANSNIKEMEKVVLNRRICDID